MLIYSQNLCRMGVLFYICCSIMQACCDVAFKYAHEREAFGQKIGQFQVRIIAFVANACFVLTFDLMITFVVCQP